MNGKTTGIALATAIGGRSGGTGEATAPESALAGKRRPRTGSGLRRWAASVCAVMVVASCSRDEPAVQPQPAQAAPEAAELVFRGGRIYTLDPAAPWVEALAVRDGRIVARGSDAEIAAHTGSATRVVELEGRMLMPGINDAHSHPVVGAAGRLFKCNFAFTATPEEVRSALQQCIAARPDATWLLGGYWGSAFFDLHPLASPRGFLDEISDTQAILLTDDANHNVWVNSRALAELGIDRATPDPDGGNIGRGADGNPNGLLLETAAKQALARVPDWSPAQYVEAVREAVRIYNGLGITGMKDAGAFDPILPAYRQVDDEGGLTISTTASIRTFYGRREAPLDAATLAAIEEKRSRFAGGNLRLDTVKIFLDGVPTSARTAAMLAPYVADAAHPATDGGPVHVDAEVLKHDLVALDARGFTVKMHAAGDRSIRTALDAIEFMRRTNGNRDRVPELAHAGFIDEADLPRFAALDVAADISPQIWHPSPIIGSIESALGERAAHYWPNRSLLDSGARVVAGSDWPAGVESPSPWLGIEALVTRADPAGLTPGVLWAEQSVTLAEALRIYTVNGAAALRISADSGSLEVGKRADLIVLDRNLFEIEPGAVGDTRVLQTWFAGKQVYTAPPGE